jgi:hypothetical protein
MVIVIVMVMVMVMVMVTSGWKWIGALSSITIDRGSPRA